MSAPSQEAKPGETLTYTLDMHQVEGERLLLQVYDYAMNTTTYKIKLGGAATVDTKFMAFYLLPNDNWYWDNAGWIGFDEAVNGDVTAPGWGRLCIYGGGVYRGSSIRHG